MAKVTIKDVALLSGVSYTTVSHVINNTRYVDPNTKKKVLDAIRELDYRPNVIARSLRSGKSKTIGLILPDVSNLYFGEFARKIEDLGFQKGYSVILCNSDNDPTKQKNYIHTLISKQVDGVIFISSGGETDDLLPLIDNNVPIVVTDRDAPVELADIVLIDNEQAGYEATKYLISIGHTCIGCITGPNFLAPSMQRVEGYKRAHREYGLTWDADLIVSSDFTIKGGEIAMNTLFNKPDKPTAVFVLNDMMAIGVMTAARKSGLTLPDDLSIVGFDDIELAASTSPSLTTVAQPIEDMAQSAVALLVDRLQGVRNDANQRIILNAGLIERESSIKRER